MKTFASQLICFPLPTTMYASVFYEINKIGSNTKKDSHEINFYSTQQKNKPDGVTILNVIGKEPNLFVRNSEKVVNTFFQQTDIGCKKRINVVKEITH